MSSLRDTRSVVLRRRPVKLLQLDKTCIAFVVRILVLVQSSIIFSQRWPSMRKNPKKSVTPTTQLTRLNEVTDEVEANPWGISVCPKASTRDGNGSLRVDEPCIRDRLAARG